MISRLALFCLLVAALAGCSGQRPLHRVMDSGDRALSMGRYDTAAQEFGEVVERDGGNWEAHYKFGLSCLELERYAEARRSLEIAATFRPAHRGIAEALAETMYRQGDHDHLFAYLRSRAEREQTPDAYLALARYAMELGDADSAKVALDTAIVLDEGRHVEPYLAAATFAEQIGDLDQAVRRLRQAFGVNPHDERVRRRLTAMGEVPGPTLALPPGR